MTTTISGSGTALVFPDGTTQSSGIASTGGVVQVAGGGTGASTLTANNVLLGNGTSALQAVAPGTAGNVLTSNGTTWASSSLPASGTVTSVATGNGLSGGTITSTGTLAIACPAANTVGSYAFCRYFQNGTALNYGSNYAVGSGSNTIIDIVCYNLPLDTWVTQNAPTYISGTWKWLGAGGISNGETAAAIACRVS